MSDNTDFKRIDKIYGLKNNIINSLGRLGNSIKAINNIKGVPLKPYFIQIQTLCKDKTIEGSIILSHMVSLNTNRDDHTPILSPFSFLIMTLQPAIPRLPFEAPSKFIIYQSIGG